MELYNKLTRKKEKGIKLNLDDLTPKQLKILFINESKTDRMIAELFDVKRSQISYLRKKHGITLRNSIIDEFLHSRSKRVDKLNDQMKEEMLTSANITKISKAITYFAFRNGPIEDMHADPKKRITDNDMQLLNQFMVNRLAYVFTLINENKWIEFSHLVEGMKGEFDHDWDAVIPDDGNNKELFESIFEQFRN